MSITNPNKNWWKVPLGKDEKIWSGVIILMILMMGSMTVGWVFTGDQNPPDKFTSISNENFLSTATSENVASKGVFPGKLSNGNTSLDRFTSGDIYLVAQRFTWFAPSSDLNGSTANGVKFKVGLTYRMHLGSIDVLHGFQIVGDNWIISLQVVPGYDYYFDFTPTTTGLFQIICNEFCGIGHHTMLGFLEVVA